MKENNMKYPIGIQSFEQIVNDGYVYIDKTELIKAMAVRYKLSEDKMKFRIKRKYDGYHFSPNMLDIYNPFSVLNALSKNMLSEYWFQSGSPSCLVRLMSHFRENLNELVGKYYGTEAFIGYKANVEAPLPMIYQSGYLTIKDWNMDTNSYLLDFPNDEVRRGFVSLLASNYFKSNESADAYLQKIGVLLGYVNKKFCVVMLGLTNVNSCSIVI